MASGWWKSTHENLAEGSPVDFAVTSAPLAPRGYPKLASIATGAGLFLGGTPCITINNVIYYASDDYTQDTDRPVLARYDGRICTEVLMVPYITGTTPSKAILSLAADDTGRIFISTWDSGTTSSDFAGRVFVLDTDSTVTRIDGGLFTGGKLPLALVWFNDDLYVGVSKQDPASTTEVIKLPVDGGLPGGPTGTSATLTGTSYSYQVGGIDGDPATGLFTNHSNTVTVKNRASLNSTTKNQLDWTNPGGTIDSYRINKTGTGCIADITSAATVTYTDDGIDRSAGIYAEAGAEAITLTVTPLPAQSTTTTYKVGALVNGFEFLSDAFSTTAPATLETDLYVTVAWGAVTGATAYRVYRTAGHSSTGLIVTTADLTINDTGLAATTAAPETYSTTALSSGAVACLVVYGDYLYVGSYQPASTFGKVFRIDTSGTLTTSQTAAPGGSAAAYNGYTAGFVFEDNLYMGYWNDDATDVCLIEKFNGSSWSTVSTVSGAGARPWVVFGEADDVAYAYGGGDAKTGILYESEDGTSWTDISTLLPSSKEAIPFMANANVVGGF